jgi:hypothetical protein
MSNKENMKEKALIKVKDMSDDMIKDAIILSCNSIEKYTNERDMA